jgi:RHS repeat-associated protein
MGKVAAVTTMSGDDLGASTISFEYDADGNLTASHDPAGNTVQTVYDVRGRKISMVDPDMGSWSYGYDGFGDLTSQTDGKSQSTSMTYDVLGRLLTKTDPTGTAEWVYDAASGAGFGRLAAMISAPDVRLAAPCSVPYVTHTDQNRTGKSFAYDSFGEVQAVSECADGQTFVTTHEYDRFGRESAIRYPQVNGARFAVGYSYTGFGFLQYLTDVSAAAPGTLLWKATEMNALGQVTHELTANGVETIQTRNPSTGWLRASSSTAHADNETLIQQWGYAFDEAGNLRTRTRSDQLNALGSVETFGYDGLDRLTSSNVTVGATQQASGFGYDALGNLTTKDGKDYAYTGCVAGERPAGPHAVCYVGGVGPFLYDGNGNMVSGLDRTLTYNPSNMVTHVDSHPAVSNGNDTGTVDFVYGADDTRVVQAVSGPNGASARTIYVGLGGTGKSLYERTTNGATTEHVHFIYAGGAHMGNAFALRVITEGGASQPTTAATKYNHFDHLGSITAVSDESGHVINSDWGGADAGLMGYDPWGARRSPDGRAANPASFDLPVGRRGFTSQETIPNVGLINMNGRVYDPVVGRFLSPDPTIQFPTDLQDYNRYSYVKNNPLRYTDPTGFFINAGFDQFVEFGIAMVGVGVCFGSGGAGCGIAFALIGAAYNATSMAASGASFEQVVNSLAISAGFGFIGGAVAGGAGEAVFGPETLGAKLMGGAIGGAFSGLAGGVARGDKLSDLGVNIFEGAAQAAGTAAMTWTMQQMLALSMASAAPVRGGIDSPQLKAAEAQIANKSMPRFQILRPLHWWLYMWFFSVEQEYAYTDQAAAFFQKIIDHALAGTGQHLDVSAVRFTVDPTLVGWNGDPDDGRWLSGMHVALRHKPGDTFIFDFVTPAHEVFHIAQGLVAGAGNLDVGHEIVLLFYGEQAGTTGSTRYDLVPVTQKPYETAAGTFSNRLLNAYFPDH